MTKNIIHTFAILAYKESPYLEECIVSLKKQTIKSNIFISTSTPSLFLRQIADKHSIPIVINSQKSSIATDWSFAYENSKTKYVTLAHQDDIYVDKYTESILPLAKKYDKNLITFTNYLELSKNKLKVYNINLIIKRSILFLFFLIKKNFSSSFWKYMMLSLGSFICCPSVMYNKERIGKLKFDKSFCVSIDWDTWLKLARKQGDFIYIKKKLMIHRIHEDTETTRCIKGNIRRKEDTRLFQQIWPGYLAKALSWLYALSYKSNK